MKYFHSMILTALMIHWLPLSAEILQEEEAPPSIASELNSDMEDVQLTALDEELSLFEEEFEEFKEELSSMEEILQSGEHAAAPSAPESAPFLQVEAAPEQVAIAETPLSLSQTPTEESPVVSDAIMELAELEGTPSSVLEVSVAEEEMQEAPATLVIESSAVIGEAAPLESDGISINLKQAFAGSPVIYSLLFSMSILSVGIWIYSLLSIRSSAQVPHTLLKNMQNRLGSNSFGEALSLCENHSNLFCKMVATGIHTRRHGLPMMIEAMRAEGKRATISFWQRIGILNDIAIIAPMIGLLGTVLGMFYAFYDINRSIESISTLFDGLGISVGTTVAGLVVAILSLILHSTAKYRLVRALATVENEAQSIATQIDDRTSIHKG